MNNFNLQGGKELLDICRDDKGSAELADQLVSLCVTNKNGFSAAIEILGTSRKELQELLWKYSESNARIADNRLIKKKRSGSSFDRGGYNFG